MNKYQSQINPANQPKYPPKKPAHLKKNPLAHQAWLNAKKARNQAQYDKRNTIKCFFCRIPKHNPSLKWIEEKYYQNDLNTYREILVNNNQSKPTANDNHQYLQSVFYCSWPCFNSQLAQEEKKKAEGGVS